MIFDRKTPEQAGISSDAIYEFVKMMDDYGFSTHSVIMARGNSVIAEAYYAPYNENSQQRMYSTSKSFVSMAVGLAATEGLLSLDDRVIDYFPEYAADHTDAFMKQTTIRDSLTMRTSITEFKPWVGIYDDRVQSYYDLDSKQVPGTLYSYDSVCSSNLGVIVEKLTGKTFLQYLKDKILSEHGFSAESRTLLAPGGYSMGDSAVLCTSRDLLLFARFVLNGGNLGGRQYIDPAFMKAAVSKQTDNSEEGFNYIYNNYGYGYLIWKTPDDGFAFVGMGDQLAVCDPKRDFIFVMTADNQGKSVATRALIMHELYKSIIRRISDTPLPENTAAYGKLQSYLSSRKLSVQRGEKTSIWQGKIDGRTYRFCDNPTGISQMRVDFDGGAGMLTYIHRGKEKRLPFGIGENVTGNFPDTLRHSDTVSVMVEGSYDCAASAAWISDNTLAIRVQIIDTFLGWMSIYFSFRDDYVSLLIQKNGQYVLDDYPGRAIGRLELSK